MKFAMSSSPHIRTSDNTTRIMLDVLIALVPAPTEETKGKIIDCVQKGYMLNEKVIRHAKVVVGQ